MAKIYNFAAGPAALPASILLEAQQELLNWQGLQRSVMEMGHRGPEVRSMMEQAEQDLRDILSIPNHYRILFLGGAGRTQFAMIPMNLLSEGQKAGYLISGVWSKMAFEEAQKLRKAYCIASTEKEHYHQAPDPEDWVLQDHTRYMYYTPNETVNGTRFPSVPKTDSIPLIADMTSYLLTEPIRITDYGLIFAGAQKNIANAGLTLVIIREDLLDNSKCGAIPTMLDYDIQAKNNSLYATPPVFNCYLAGKMFRWIKAQGGVDALYKENQRKAALLYNYIDNSSCYKTFVENPYRSLINVCFTTRDTQLEAPFLDAAEKAGLYGLKGHRFVGGLRASIYNAMALLGVEALIQFMQTFAKDHQA